MLTATDIKLLENPPAGFPMIGAASAAWRKKCGTCPGKGNVRSILQIAVLKYMHNKDFINHCKTLFPLPCRIGGVMVTGD